MKHDRDIRLNLALSMRPELGTPTEVSRAAGINEVTGRSYFSGGREPPLDKCMALGRVLGVRGQWIFDGKGPMLSSPPVKDITAARFRGIPVIDEVAAGKLAAPGSQIPDGDREKVYVADLGEGDFFATKVRGNSMDRVSPDGSIIIVNRREIDLVPGRFYVFGLRGETTYKRWPGDDPAWLEPMSTDPVHKPIFIKNMRGLAVIGRVKRTLLDL